MTLLLEARLGEAGIRCRVEVRERFAILIPEQGPGGPIDINREERLRALQVARDAGFSHVALELDPDGAALPRD